MAEPGPVAGCPLWLAPSPPLAVQAPGRQARRDFVLGPLGGDGGHLVTGVGRVLLMSGPAATCGVLASIFHCLMQTCASYLNSVCVSVHSTFL